LSNLWALRVSIAQLKRKMWRPQTWVEVCGADGNHIRSDGNILKHLVAIAHGIKQRGVVVEIHNVEVYCECGGETGTTGVLCLYHEDVMLHLERNKIIGKNRHNQKDEQ